MNILLLIGIAVVLGTLSGKVLEKLRIPQVVGYIVLGVIVGKSFLHIFEDQTVHTLTPLVNFTLGIIGCVIGGELKGSVFRKYGQSIYSILLAEGLFAFIGVTIAVTVLTGKLYLGLILGAIASATDPASTVNVLWEYKAKGALTRTVTAVIALDDGLALILYGLVSVFSKAMILHQSFSWWDGVVMPVVEIGQCLALGILSALLVVRFLKHVKEEAIAISLILGVVCMGVGISMYFNLDLILSSMAFGATMANVIPQVTDRIFGVIKEMTTPLYILFFIAIGAQMDIHVFTNITILGIVIAYLIARSVGKISGATLASLATHAPKTVTRYTGLCLFTQGGVAMGLALSISHNMAQFGSQGQEAGLLIIDVVAATTFIVQLIGPPFVKYGITKAEERDCNVTKEDIIESLTAADVMDKQFIPLHEETHLHDIIQTVKEKDTFNYPVVDKEGRLQGIITLRELKDALFERNLEPIILAEDIAIPSHLAAYTDQPLKEVFDIFNKANLEFLPILEKGGSSKVVGLIEYRTLVDEIDKRWLARQKHH